MVFVPGSGFGAEEAATLATPATPATSGGAIARGRARDNRSRRCRGLDRCPRVVRENLDRAHGTQRMDSRASARRRTHGIRGRFRGRRSAAARLLSRGGRLAPAPIRQRRARGGRAGRPSPEPAGRDSNPARVRAVRRAVSAIAGAGVGGGGGARGGGGSPRASRPRAPRENENSRGDGRLGSARQTRRQTKGGGGGGQRTRRGRHARTHPGGYPPRGARRGRRREIARATRGEISRRVRRGNGSGKRGGTPGVARRLWEPRNRNGDRDLDVRPR